MVILPQELAEPVEPVVLAQARCRMELTARQVPQVRPEQRVTTEPTAPLVLTVPLDRRVPWVQPVLQARTDLTALQVPLVTTARMALTVRLVTTARMALTVQPARLGRKAPTVPQVLMVLHPTTSEPMAAKVLTVVSGQLVPLVPLAQTGPQGRPVATAGPAKPARLAPTAISERTELTEPTVQPAVLAMPDWSVQPVRLVLMGRQAPVARRVWPVVQAASMVSVVWAASA